MLYTITKEEMEKIYGALSEERFKEIIKRLEKIRGVAAKINKKEI